MNSNPKGMYLEFDFKLNLNQFDLKLKGSLKQMVTGVFGTSGSGKTSFVESIIGLRSGGNKKKRLQGKLTWKGSVWFDSAHGTHLPVHQRNIGYVSQEALLFPHKNVEENLRLGELRFKRSQKTDDLFEAAVETLNLKPLLKRSVTSLSGGEKQRVALGRAVCSQPDLLVMDEPLASLDGELKEKIKPYLMRIKEKFNIPMLMVSHSPEDMIELCDEVLILEQGQLLTRGNPIDIFNNFYRLKKENQSHCKNYLTGCVVGEDKDKTRILLSGASSAHELSVPPLNKKAGDKVVLSLPAREVIISLEPLYGLSAQNILSATLTEIQEYDYHVLVSAQLMETEIVIVAEVTPQATQKLGLKVGIPVFLVIKSHSFVV